MTGQPSGGEQRRFSGRLLQPPAIPMVDLNRTCPFFRSLASAVVLVAVCAVTVGADYDAGERAWNAGKPAEALAQWRTAAGWGDRRAMLELGRLYLKGLGVPQDYALAHMWFNLVTGRGEVKALQERDALARE